MFALFQQPQQDVEQPEPEGVLPVEQQWYDDQYNNTDQGEYYAQEYDTEVPLEQAEVFDETAYDYTYYPDDKQPQQQEETQAEQYAPQESQYYPEQEDETQNVEEDKEEDIEPSDEEIANNLVFREPWSEKEIPMSAMSGFIKPRVVVNQDDKKDRDDDRRDDDKKDRDGEKNDDKRDDKKDRDAAEKKDDKRDDKKDRDGEKNDGKQYDKKDRDGDKNDKGKQDTDSKEKIDQVIEVVDKDADEFERIWNVDFDDLLKKDKIPLENKYVKYWKRVLVKVDKPKGEESDMSMAQQKNEMRNLFKESTKPGNFNEDRDVQKVKNLTDNVWIRYWWKMFNDDVSGGTRPQFGHYMAQCSLLCATLLMSIVSE